MIRLYRSTAFWRASISFPSTSFSALNMVFRDVLIVKHSVAFVGFCWDAPSPDGGAFLLRVLRLGCSTPLLHGSRCLPAKARNG